MVLHRTRPGISMGCGAVSSRRLSGGMENEGAVPRLVSCWEPVASPTGRALAPKINALIMRWDSFSFAVSHTFSK